MKIKVLSLNIKTALATAVYYLAIVALLVLLGAILFKFAFSPPCSFIAKNECMVDGWSVAGLAGTVLAVAATLLAVLGAVAVAYWWLNLNEKVDRRVDEQIKIAIDRALQEQEEKISEQTAHLLTDQERKFDETSSNIRKDVDALKELASDIEKKVQWSIDQLVIAITQLDPWTIELWATEYMTMNPSSEVAVRMVRKYLQFVDGFFPNDPNDLSAVLDFTKSLKNKSAPYDTPLGYWQKALDWQKTIRLDLNPEGAGIVAQFIEYRRANIEAWKKQRGLSI
jgi:hypothetical protein